MSILEYLKHHHDKSNSFTISSKGWHISFKLRTFFDTSRITFARYNIKKKCISFYVDGFTFNKTTVGTLNELLTNFNIEGEVTDTDGTCLVYIDKDGNKTNFSKTITIGG